ncbi:ABC transporter permease [Aurantiacibacter sp. MUD61]|uniref:ABC transporter permease n=1 Tax=Aurantiacibacter sp. MUD61 TaxID=3009083 RepID=UPI0022F0BF55|nr:ABC transporter permease [Aurantiacibacter sp. MUD61]
MREVMLVAMREIRQVLGTKGFWFMIAAVPVALAISGFASSKLAPERSVAFSIVDETDAYEERITARLELDYQASELRDLAEYVERWELQDAVPDAPWASRQSWLIPAEIQRFADMGGSEAAIEALEPFREEGVPEFEPDDRSYEQVAFPDGLNLPAAGEEPDEQLIAALEGDVDIEDRELPFGAVLQIPANFGEPGAEARVFTNGRSNTGLIRIIREELSGSLRDGAFAAQGIAPDAALAIQGLQAPVSVIEPPPGAGRSVVATRSVVPIALVYLLLITAVTTGSLMLQGVVEERSNKLVESVLACIKPDALMQGKLLGLGAVGFMIIVVWAGTGLIGALYFEGFAADVLRPSLEALDDPLLIFAMLFYFVTGYIVLAMMFLAIGAVSESMQDAQSYLTPVILLIMIPVLIVMQAAISGPDQLVVKVLSWIPIYTPFAMLARLGTGVATWEIIGTMVLMVIFVWIELRLLGRLFRASLLNDGKPTWKRMVGWLKSSEAGR